MTARGDGTTLARSDVPRRTQSARLTAYPKDLLCSPLDVRSLQLSVTPGGPRLSAATPAEAAPAAGLTRGADRLTLAFEGLLTRTEGNPWLGFVAVLAALALGAGARGRAGARQDDHGVLPVRPPRGCAALGRDRRRDRDRDAHRRRARRSGCSSAPAPPSCRPGSTPGSASPAAPRRAGRPDPAARVRPPPTTRASSDGTATRTVCRRSCNAWGSLHRREPRTCGHAPLPPLSIMHLCGILVRDAEHDHGPGHDHRRSRPRPPARPRCPPRTSRGARALARPPAPASARTRRAGRRRGAVPRAG